MIMKTTLLKKIFLTTFIAILGVSQINAQVDIEYGFNGATWEGWGSGSATGAWSSIFANNPNGALQITYATDTKNAVMYPPNSGLIDANTYKYLQIIVSNESSQINQFRIRINATGWATLTDIAIITNTSGNFTTYDIDLSSLGAWTGSALQYQIIFRKSDSSVITDGGTVFVDNILFSKNPTAILDAPTTLPADLDEADYFTDNTADFPQSQRLTLQNLGEGSSAKLQEQINWLSNSANSYRGGVITIGAGDWILGEINMRSNIHLMIDKDAVIKPVINWSAANMSIFKVGYQGTKVENVSIRCVTATGEPNGDKFTIDFRDVPMPALSATGVPTNNPARITPFNIKEAENFMVADCLIEDNITIHAAANLSASKRDNVWAGPVKGLVKNLTSHNAHGGYGVVQVRTAKKILFKHLESTKGGITLRIESDDFGASGTPQEIAKVSEISAYDIKCKDGNAAVMTQPWGADNGWFDVQKIEATGCMAAVRLDEVYTKEGHTGIGSFNPNSRITEVTKCTYGANAQVKQGINPWVPCELRADLLQKPFIPYMETYRIGPSVATLLYRAASDNSTTSPKFYNVNVPSEAELAAVTTGFPSYSLVVSYQNNRVDSCDTMSDGSLNPLTHNIKIFPNPLNKGNGLLTIDMPTVKDVSIAIFDLTGKSLFSKNYNKQSKIVINSSELSLNTGLYILKVKSDSYSVTQKLMVQ